MHSVASLAVHVLTLVCSMMVSCGSMQQAYANVSHVYGKVLWHLFSIFPERVSSATVFSCAPHFADIFVYLCIHGWATSAWQPRGKS